MICNLFFFLIVISSLSDTHLLAMDIYEGWVRVDTGNNDAFPDNLKCVTFTGDELKNLRALAYAIKHGFSPKLIKRLAPSDKREEMLAIARSNFIKKFGTKYALEEAIAHNNLNFIKTTMNQPDAEDITFRAHIFGIALFQRRIKTALYICKTTPNLFSIETNYLILEYLAKAISDKSLRPLKILFKHLPHRNFEIPSDFKNEALSHCLEESKSSDFAEATFFLIKIKAKVVDNRELLIKTL